MTVVKVLGTNHTGITVQDLDYTVSFFTNVLGYDLVGERSPRGLTNMEKVTGVADCHVEIAYVKGGGHAVELLQYNGPDDRQVYQPRCVDVGHWHLSINVEDIDAAIEESLEFGCTRVGELITVDGGPNRGNKVQYIALRDGMIIEMTWVADQALGE